MSVGLRRTSSSRSMLSDSSSSSRSSFWDTGTDSESEYDASHEFSEWRECLRGMEAKYPRGKAGGTVKHKPSGKCDAAESVQRQGVLRPSEDIGSRSPPESWPQPQATTEMRAYTDDPPAYEVAVGDVYKKPNRSTVSVAAQLAKTKDGAHLALFQSLAEDVQKNPYIVIHRISKWLMDPESPSFWIPFGLSIRGLAHEQIDRNKYAQKDYAEGIRRFYQLRQERGETVVHRLKANVRFMEFRIKKLGGAVPIDRTSRSKR
ncbi:hypothetical protein RhiJN_11784 [Ceratobasidium sp. AG-Ba]|nr:hypothetical protein RhiJN_11784 [Ceratobasidium sp. AG-Ba]QRW12408.1 hypothetical protein RhiLY_11407 [Ceratobasidium sp. AG-Ba]